GIAVLGAFIFGLDTDTPLTIANRVEYMLNSDIDAMQASILTPLPGTPLFNRMVAEDRLIHKNFPE
ncbi:MAG: B12-binding domain-containing radical SAM protein, partial [Bacteroidetes bacterium CG_4_10_14_3_um_filter_42_6]